MRNGMSQCHPVRRNARWETFNLFLFVLYAHPGHYDSIVLSGRRICLCMDNSDTRSGYIYVESNVRFLVLFFLPHNRSDDDGNLRLGTLDERCDDKEKKLLEVDSIFFFFFQRYSIFLRIHTLFSIDMFFEIDYNVFRRRLSLRKDKDSSYVSTDVSIFCNKLWAIINLLWYEICEKATDSKPSLQGS